MAILSHEVERMCTVAKGPHHGPAPIPEEGKWVKAYEIKDISGLSHGIGWCAPQQGMCKLTLNVKEGIIEEALVETSGCSGMTHSAAMAAEILQGIRPHSDRILRKRSARRCFSGRPGQRSALSDRYYLRYQGKGRSLPRNG